MNRIARWGAGGMVIAFLLGTFAYANREAIVLKLVGFAVKRRIPVGPHQEVAWSTGVDPQGRTPAERPPNIVLILADDLGWNDLTFNGGGVAGGTVPTPHIDSIAAEGVSFTNGYAANGTCAPSRAALMSGRYGTRFGFEFTPTPPGMMQLAGLVRSPGRLRETITYEGVERIDYADMGMPASEITLAELLAEQGYHTAHIGKWHLGRADGMAPHDQGFDESLLMASGLYLPEDDPDVVNSKQDFDPIDRFLWAAMRFAASFNGDDAFEPDQYLTDYYTEQAVEVIGANRDRPFFLYLAHWAPHTPLQAARRDYEALAHIENHRLRVYAAMIRSLDRGVGQVLRALERNGLDENTLVLFTSDNGGANYIGLPEVNRPFRGWKISLFEGGIHVPFFAKWPARIAAGATVSNPVHHFDLYATAAAAAGAPLPTDRTMDGVDLLPHVAGEAPGVPHRALFWRSGASQTALVDGWKLNVSDPPGRTWLFDMGADPTEQHDLSAERPEKLAELQAALAAHNAEQAPPAWPSQLSVPINIDKDLTQADAPDDEYIYWSN
ncbi:MAG: sulfatase-like hydrolase/transferase [Deltaproteobacteria bacterium]|nr:sulfatase-like hydrolase/transferase [Deltaproteobacteria bacterium]